MNEMSMDHWWKVSNRKTKVFGENAVPLPLCPSHIQHKLVWDWASVVRLWVTAWAMVWLLPCCHVVLGRMSVSSATHQPTNGWIAFQLLVGHVINFCDGTLETSYLIVCVLWQFIVHFSTHCQLGRSARCHRS